MLGDYIVSHYETKKRSYEHVPNSEWLPRQSCLNLQIPEHDKW